MNETERQSEPESSGNDARRPELALAEDLWRIDVRGADGQPGRDGQGLAGRSAARGCDGRSGGDATGATAGQRSGDIDISCRSPAGSEGLIELEGRAASPSGREQPIRHRTAFGHMGSIRLIATGGKGGDGGRGGDGEDGGRGRDGTDATRWSSGGDGGRGGDGGDGGDGTSGAAGGDGGQIVVRVDQRDTHLLMLLEHEVEGGDGGRAGANGRGGAGGRGGDGGRSYSWTTTSTESYTDSQGRSKTRTRTHHHRNPGGSDGPPGQRGRDGQASLAPGRSGNPGTYCIFVQQDDAVVQYLQRYEVEIVAYQLNLPDNFAEPASSLSVSQVLVRNSGGMPTPAAHPPVVQLAAGSWITPAPGTLGLPTSLEPGEQYAFEGDVLSAHVPDLDTVPVGEPLNQVERASPLAIQPGVNRRFANLHARREFTVAFPADIARVASLESQTPGQAALLEIQVSSRSRFDLGRQSPGRRRLVMRITLLGDALARHVLLADMQGSPVSWDTGYEEEIPLLKAGESVTLRCVIGVLPGAPGYTRADLAVTLQLGQIERPDEVKPRHERRYPLRIAQSYVFDPAADFLLIANHGTTRQEKSAWENVASRLGKKLNIWDISLNDALSLSDVLAHGQNLLRDFHGKTIVLCNAPFETSLGTRYGDQFLSQMDLIRACESHGIRVLAVNDSAHEIGHLFGDRLIPTDGEPDFRYSSVNDFDKAKSKGDVDVLLDQVEELIEHGGRAARPNPIRQTSEIRLYGVRSPNRRRLRRQAERLQRRLQNGSPGRRVVVTYALPSELPAAERAEKAAEGGHDGLFFTHDFQGLLTVMPTLGDGHPNLIVIDATPDQIHDPDFISSSGLRAALIQAVSFEEKVFLLADQLRSLSESARLDPESAGQADIRLGQALVDSILVDLSSERAAILKTGWKPLFFGDTIHNSLGQLRLLAEHPFALVSPDLTQPDAQLAIRLIAGVTFLARSSSRWYESRWFPWGFYRRGPVLRAETGRYCEDLRKNVFGRTTADQVEAIEKQVNEYLAAARRGKRERRCSLRVAADGVLRASLSQRAIRLDTGESFPGVLSYSEWQAVRTGEEQRDEARTALQERKERDRAHFAVARDGRPLPGLAPDVLPALAPFIAANDSARAQQRTEVATRDGVPATLPDQQQDTPRDADPSLHVQRPDTLSEG